MFKAHERRTSPNVHPMHLVLMVHLMRLSTLTPINRDSSLNSGFFYVSSEVFFSFSFDSYISSSSALLQTSLPKEPLETLNASTTFDFMVSVYNSNLFRVPSLLECFHSWRCSISFREGFWFTLFSFYPWWVIKISRGDFFFLSSFFIFALWTSS